MASLLKSQAQEEATEEASEKDTQRSIIDDFTYLKIGSGNIGKGPSDILQNPPCNIANIVDGFCGIQDRSHQRMIVTGWKNGFRPGENNWIQS